MVKQCKTSDAWIKKDNECSRTKISRHWEHVSHKLIRYISVTLNKINRINDLVNWKAILFQDEWT